jgi:hypothetical protein
MKNKIVKATALILAMLCILCFPIPASAVSQGTDGTELLVMKPQNLQIHLGEDWAGAGFELTTDAGKYPGVIVVGEDGVLRLEIGGSENYILSCLNSSADIPFTGDELQQEEGSEAPTEPEEGTVPVESTPEDSEEGTQVQIPVKHMVLFVGGLIVALVALAGIHYGQSKRAAVSREDEEDDI